MTLTVCCRRWLCRYRRSLTAHPQCSQLRDRDSRVFSLKCPAGDTSRKIGASSLGRTTTYTPGSVGTSASVSCANGTQPVKPAQINRFGHRQVVCEASHSMRELNSLIRSRTARGRVMMKYGMLRKQQIRQAGCIRFDVCAGHGTASSADALRDKSAAKILSRTCRRRSLGAAELSTQLKTQERKAILTLMRVRVTIIRRVTMNRVRDEQVALGDSGSLEYSDRGRARCRRKGLLLLHAARHSASPTIATGEYIEPKPGADRLRRAHSSDRGERICGTP